MKLKLYNPIKRRWYIYRTKVDCSDIYYAIRILQEGVEKEAIKGETDGQKENIRSILCVGDESNGWHQDWYKIVGDKLVCTACISELAYSHLKRNRWRWYDNGE